jgi:hypothetical protein
MVAAALLIAEIGSSWAEGRAGTAAYINALLGGLFDGHAVRSDSAFPTFQMLFLMGYIFSVNAGRPLRHLRMLPLGVLRVNAVILSNTVFGWAMIWTALVVAHHVVLGRWPLMLRLDLLFLFMGLTALVAAVQTRWRFAGPLSLIVWMPLSSRFSTAPYSDRLWLASVVAGLAAFATSVWINHYLLTRSSRLYSVGPWELPFMPGRRP